MSRVFFLFYRDTGLFSIFTAIIVHCPTRIQIIERSAGIPGVFFSILKNPESIKTISSHPPKKIDMTWILLSIISFIIIMRFIALGTNDTEKYILAGILYGLSFMFRPFIYKGMRKE